MCIHSIVDHMVFNVFTACSVVKTKANFHIVDRKVLVFACLEDQMLAGNVRQSVKTGRMPLHGCREAQKKRQAAFSGCVLVRSAS